MTNIKNILDFSHNQVEQLVRGSLEAAISVAKAGNNNLDNFINKRILTGPKEGIGELTERFAINGAKIGMLIGAGVFGWRGYELTNTPEMMEMYSHLKDSNAIAYYLIKNAAGTAIGAVAGAGGGFIIGYIIGGGAGTGVTLRNDDTNTPDE